VITFITQGPDGRIWIGHHAGLSVYNGAEFQNWGTEDGLLSCPPDSLVVDRNNIVWLVFSSRGMQYMGEDRDFHTIPDQKSCFKKDQIFFLFEMSDGTILASGYKGYYKVKRGGIDGPFYPVEGKHEKIYSIVDLGKEKGILMAARDGVFLLKEGIKEKLPLPYERLDGTMVSDIVIGNNEEIWFVTGNAGVVKWKEGKYDFFSLDPEQKIEKIPVFKAAVDPFDNLWVASGEGLFQCKGGKVERFTEKSGLSSRWINSLFLDNEGVLWFGSEGGLEKISQMAFRNYCYKEDLPVNGIWAIRELPDKSVWVGTNSGIIVFDPQGNTRLIDEKEGLPEKTIVDLYPTKDGKVWILSYYAVHLWDGKKFISFPFEPFEPINLYGILPLNRNEVWISTSEGIFSLDPLKRKVQKHPINKEMSDLSSINHIAHGRNGEVIISGKKVYIWKNGNKLREIQFPGARENFDVIKTHVEENRYVFITNEGLKFYDGEKWEEFPLKNKKIFDMVKTGSGNYWLGCNSGVARFDGRSYRFFGYYDGVAVEECNSGTALLDSQGRVWLGGKNLTVIDPTLIRTFPSKKPLITKMQIGNWTYFFPKKLEFYSRARSIGFYFATPSFFNEKEQLFRYRLMDLEKNWSHPTTEHSIRYAGIPPGDHTFEVQSRQKYGDWDGSSAVLFLTVKPSFWQSTAGKLFIGFMILFIGSIIGVLVMKKRQGQRARFSKLVKEKTAEIKSQKDRLAQLASTDEVTRLPNRRKFMERLDFEIARAKRYERKVSLCVFDIDDYKNIKVKRFTSPYPEVSPHLLLRMIKVRQARFYLMKLTKPCIRRKRQARTRSSIFQICNILIHSEIPHANNRGELT
jgi:ligand-binding sensor domain-containing protein